MGEHYITPVELLLLMVFIFTPAWLIGALVQSWVFHFRGIFSRHAGRAFVALSATLVLSGVSGALLILWSPSVLPRSLGVVDAALFGTHLPVSPTPYLLVGTLAPVFVWWACRQEPGRAA